MIHRKEMSLNFSAIAVLSWLKLFPFEFNLKSRQLEVATSSLRRVAHALWLYFAFLHSFYLSNCFIDSLYSYWYTEESYRISLSFISFVISVIVPTWNWKLFVVYSKLQANIFNGFSFNQHGWLYQNIAFCCSGFPTRTSSPSQGRYSRSSWENTPSMSEEKVQMAEKGKRKNAILKFLLRYLPVCFCPLLLIPAMAYFTLPQVPFSWLNLVPEDCRTLLVISACLLMDTSIVVFWVGTGYYFCLVTLCFLESFNEEIDQLINKLRYPGVSFDALAEVTGTLRVLRLKLQRFSYVTSYVTCTCKLLSVFLVMFCLHTSLRLMDTNTGISIASSVLGIISAVTYATLDRTLLMPSKMDEVKSRVVELSQMHNKFTQKEIKVVVRSISSSELPAGQLFKFRRDSTPSYLSCIAIQVMHLQSAL